MHEDMDLITKELKKSLNIMPDFLSKIIFLQGNQLERLLNVDVIAQQRPFFQRKFGGLKGKQRKCKSIFVEKMV